MITITGWSKKVKALIKSFQSETQTTRTQGGNPYFIPPGISLDEHYQFAMEAGMDPREYEKRNGASSSQPYPHQDHEPFQSRIPTDVPKRLRNNMILGILQYQRLSLIIVHKNNRRNTKVSRNVNSLKYLMTLFPLNTWPTRNTIDKGRNGCGVNKYSCKISIGTSWSWDLND